VEVQEEVPAPDSGEPPSGHRLLREGEVIQASDMWKDKEWEFLHPDAYSVGKPWSEEEYLPYARKIEPPENVVYEQEMWSVPKDSIYAAIQALKLALGYMPLIKTDVPQWAKTVEIDVESMENALEELRKLGAKE
jgi:hypothetical protein